MAPEYRLDIKSRTGSPRAVLVGSGDSGFLSTSYYKQINAPGVGQFSMNADNTVIDMLDVDGQVEWWRRDAERGIPWYRDFSGLFRDPEYVLTEDGTETFTAYCIGDLDLLARREILYYAGTAGRSTYTSLPAETIAKAIVRYNATSAGTTGDGRRRNAAFDGWTITIQTDAGAGTVTSGGYAWKNVLAALQELSHGGAGDVDLVKTGPATWDFRWYNGQRGTDRSSTVSFSKELGNIASARYRRNRLGERTVIIAGGQGNDTDRAIAVRPGATYSSTNDIEEFVNANNQSTTAGLNSFGDAKADELKARDEFEIVVLQTDSTLYGLHYCVAGELGDLVHVTYRGIDGPLQIYGVNVSYSAPAGQRLKLEMRTR